MKGKIEKVWNNQTQKENFTAYCKLTAKGTHFGMKFILTGYRQDRLLNSTTRNRANTKKFQKYTSLPGRKDILSVSKISYDEMAKIFLSHSLNFDFFFCYYFSSPIFSIL